MSGLRVGFITFDLYPYEVRSLRLTEAAVDAGYSVDVICLRKPGEKNFAVHNGARVHRLPIDRPVGRSLPLTILYWCWFLLLAGITITRLHLKHAYDVIHVHNIPDFLVFSAFFPRLLGAKVILDVEDVTPELMGAKAKGRTRRIVIRLATWQEQISAAFANHVITVGWPFEKLLLQRGVPGEKITSILNSADPKLFPAARRLPALVEAPKDEHPFILMYHGTLAKRNGLDIAIRALAIARQAIPQLRLDIHGRGEQVPFLKQLAVELGVKDRVIFTSSCPPDELVDVVVHGDVGIIPYPYDGFMELVLPTKAYEWAWMHRPIIASDTPAIRSMFQPESIALCDPSKPEDFAEAIIDLYQHPEKRARMVENAARDYMPFQWELMARHYQQLLSSLSRKEAREGKDYSMAAR